MYISKNFVEQYLILSCLNTPSFYCVLQTDLELETASSKQGWLRFSLCFSLVSCVGDSSAFFWLLFLSNVFVGCFLKCPWSRYGKASHFAYDWHSELVTSVMKSTVRGDVNLRERTYLFIFSVFNWESITDLCQNETESLLVWDWNCWWKYSGLEIYAI